MAATTSGSHTLGQPVSKRTLWGASGQLFVATMQTPSACELPSTPQNEQAYAAIPR